MPTRDPYELLGVLREASGDDIRQAYRKLARQHHPDANPDATEAKQRVKEVHNHYEILSNPGKRCQYHERFRTSSRKRRGGSRRSNWASTPLIPSIALSR